jgi:hypothetical protein
MAAAVAAERLEPRSAALAVARASVRAVDACGRDEYRVVREERRHDLTARTVRNAVQHHRVHVEPEAERLHEPTVALVESLKPVRFA